MEFCGIFRKHYAAVPLAVIPSTYSMVYEDELIEHGINIVIYANQLTRSMVPAMQSAAVSILENQRAFEADKFCMPINEIIKLIPEV
jgi:phosphoenolpyruvate phosphomutase